MKRLVLILALAAPLPAFAQDDGNPSLMFLSLYGAYTAASTLLR